MRVGMAPAACRTLNRVCQCTGRKMRKYGFESTNWLVKARKVKAKKRRCNIIQYRQIVLGTFAPRKWKVVNRNRNMLLTQWLKSLMHAHNIGDSVFLSRALQVFFQWSLTANYFCDDSCTFIGVGVSGNNLRAGMKTSTTISECCNASLYSTWNCMSQNASKKSVKLHKQNSFWI